MCCSKMLRRGKHAGRLNHEVAAADPWYCAWALRERAEGKTLPRDLKALANFIENEHGGVMEVGKHRGKFFDKIIEDDPDYADWAACLESASKLMINFQRYVQRQRKRPREPCDDVCSICMQNGIDCALIPCGHMTGCLSCVSRLYSCPICRDAIADCLKIYPAGSSAGSS